MLADGATYHQVSDWLRTELWQNCSKLIQGSSIDLYWTPAPDKQASFTRLRVSGDDVTLTTKVVDKGSIQDRKEWNVDIPFKQKDDLVDSLTASLGEPVPLMFTWLDCELAYHTVISVIQNVEAPQYVFVEVECQDRKDVDHWVERLKAQAGEFNLREVKNSFHDIFVKKQGVLL